MDEGDHLYVARRPDDTVLFIVVPGDSTIASQLSWLFGIGDAQPGLFVAREIIDQADARLDFAAVWCLTRSALNTRIRVPTN